MGAQFSFHLSICRCYFYYKFLSSLLLLLFFWFRRGNTRFQQQLSSKCNGMQIDIAFPVAVSARGSRRHRRIFFLMLFFIVRSFMYMSVGYR